MEVDERCGNIYADLDYDNPEECKEKSDIAIEIYREIKKKNINHSAAATALGLTEKKLTAILRGNFLKSSKEELEIWLRGLKHLS